MWLLMLPLARTPAVSCSRTAVYSVGHVGYRTAMHRLPDTIAQPDMLTLDNELINSYGLCAYTGGMLQQVGMETTVEA
jgi:hypothetical protein